MTLLLTLKSDLSHMNMSHVHRWCSHNDLNHFVLSVCWVNHVENSQIDLQFVFMSLWMLTLNNLLVKYWILHLKCPFCEKWNNDMHNVIFHTSLMMLLIEINCHTFIFMFCSNCFCDLCSFLNPSFFYQTLFLRFIETLPRECHNDLWGVFLLFESHTIHNPLLDITNDLKLQQQFIWTLCSMHVLTLLFHTIESHFIHVFILLIPSSLYDFWCFPFTCFSKSMIINLIILNIPLSPISPSLLFLEWQLSKGHSPSSILCSLLFVYMSCVNLLCFVFDL